MNLDTLLFRRFFGLATALLVSACGPPSVCDRLPGVQSVVTQRRGSCAVTLTLGTVDGCEAALSAGRCSAEDERGVGRVYDCYARLPACVPGSEVSWLSQLNACGAGSGISSTCRF
ncbi:MAG: hypothetical protein Q8S33_24810 [Myxococcales bacterium]|nr:hypothetical protein [Myxococcales bacterium]